MDRRTPDRNNVLGGDERTGARRALGHVPRPADEPSREPRIDVGEPGDLCLLDSPLADILVEPRAEHVAAAIVAGRVVYG
jgi:hypothetical protein